MKHATVFSRLSLKLLLAMAMLGLASFNLANAQNQYDRNTISSQQDICNPEERKAMYDMEIDIDIENLIKANILTRESTAKGLHFVEGAEIKIISNQILLVNAPGVGGMTINCGRCPTFGPCSNGRCYWSWGGPDGWGCKGKCGSEFSGCGRCGLFIIW